MSLIRDLGNWWAEHHGRRRERDNERRQKLVRQVECELAVGEARLKEIERQDARCKTFKFADKLIEARGEVALLKKNIEQNSR